MNGHQLNLAIEAVEAEKAAAEEESAEVSQESAQKASPTEAPQGCNATVRSFKYLKYLHQLSIAFRSYGRNPEWSMQVCLDSVYKCMCCSLVITVELLVCPQGPNNHCCLMMPGPSVEVSAEVI